MTIGNNVGSEVVMINLAWTEVYRAHIKPHRISLCVYLLTWWWVGWAGGLALKKKNWVWSELRIQIDWGMEIGEQWGRRKKVNFTVRIWKASSRCCCAYVIGPCRIATGWGKWVGVNHYIFGTNHFFCYFNIGNYYTYRVHASNWFAQLVWFPLEFLLRPHL